MFNSDEIQPHRDANRTEPQRWPGERRPSSFGLRAAILAGLAVATTGGAAVAAEFSDDPVRAVAEIHSTCCVQEN